MLNITAPSLCLYYNYHKYVARGNVHASNIFAYYTYKITMDTYPITNLLYPFTVNISP